MSYAYLILRRLLAELWSVIVGAGKEKKKKGTADNYDFRSRISSLRDLYQFLLKENGWEKVEKKKRKNRICLLIYVGKYRKGQKPVKAKGKRTQHATAEREPRSGTAWRR